MNKLTTFVGLALMAINSVYGHGYLTEPSSRTRLGFEAQKDSCPEVSFHFSIFNLLISI